MAPITRIRMDYPDILAFLAERDLTMVRYERDGYDAFLKKANYHFSFPFIHIAGSNGKSSVARYLENIYRQAGYKVAAFIKPVPSFLEAARIDGEAIKEADFARVFLKFEAKIKESSLTKFEIETFLFFVLFEEAKVDIAIIECGMGGEKDATNIHEMTPLLSIISSVSLEHVAFLGKDLRAIAHQKAGIIKNDSLALIGKLPLDAKKEIQKTASSRHSSLYEVGLSSNEKYLSPYYHFDYPPYSDLMVKTPARYEIDDAAIAIEAIKLLRLRYPASENAIRMGLLGEGLTCRLERISNIYLDGAHNPEAIEASVASFLTATQGKTPHVLFASYKDKDIVSNLAIIKKRIEDVTITSFPAKRARTIKDYPDHIASSYPYNESFALAINFLLTTHRNDPILVIGSLDFAYQVRAYLLKEGFR